jgi:hypothetical protein
MTPATERLLAELDNRADDAARISKAMADDKSRRNGHEPGAYTWLTPERTLFGRAAALIRELMA